ncbi:histone H1.1, embryonic-like [Patiria miniata]|uniref:H15 domain-containing protein n=1 Tax=Patiria miniata TaxID=46514 RepID=A0A914AJM1_PATMI|nr:histone H1.1, embryonic-like [Patiria miniata]
MADDDNPTAADHTAEDGGAKSKQKRKRKTSAISSTAKPKFKEMVEEAIGLTQDRGGSSLQAIKKYLSANYGLDSHNTYIRNAIKKGVTRGDLIQVKGSGASGSFKLNSASAPKPTAQTVRQKDSDKVRQEKDAKSVREAQRIARNAKKATKERQAKRLESQRKIVKAKPKAGKKGKTHKKKVEKKKTPKKTPKAKKGSRK